MSLVLITAAALVASGASELSVTLMKEGYKAVQLLPSAAGHLHTSGSLQCRKVDVLVDTGASNTVIDIEVARELGLKLTPIDQRGAGVGEASVAVNRVAGAAFSVGGIPIEGDVFTMDLSAIRAALAARGETAFQAVLGGDTMRKLDAILIYRENILLLRDGKHRPPAADGNGTIR